MLGEHAPSSAGPVSIAAGGAGPPDLFVLGDAPFWPVARLVEPDAWTGHIPFAFWIVAALQPRLLVELGTHSGNSYLAFCQAVQNLGIATACFAIDTWKGDVHAGFYDEDVYRELAEYHDDRYGAFSRLVRSTFEEAVGSFADGSVDLLHIDGLHTYEAVRADLETWRAKLSTRAVVLLHDTNVREGDFGVWRLWEELIARHPHFAFLHSHGLGVLGMGADLPDAVMKLLEATPDASRARRIRDVFARLGGSLRHRIRRQQLEAEIVRLGDVVGARDQALAARDEQLAGVTRDLKTRTDEVAEHVGLITLLQHEIVRVGQLAEAASREGAGLRVRAKGDRSEAEWLRAEVERARVRLTAMESSLEVAQGRVTAMESSKFWKIRALWFRVKRVVGAGSQE